MYRLQYRRKARNYLARLPLKTKTTIVQHLHALCSNPEASLIDVDTLKGKKGFRMRMGPYRTIYPRDDDDRVIEVVTIRPRGDVYER